MKIYANFSYCVKSFWKKSSCSKCAEACPTGALYVADGRIEVEPALCVGCGLCRSACPTGVFEFAEELKPVISCREGGPCIHGLTLEDYKRLVERYGEVTVDARCDDCKLKDRGQGMEMLKKAVEMGLKIKVIRGRGGDVSKRFLLRRLGGDSPIEVNRGRPVKREIHRGYGREGYVVAIDTSRCILCGVCAGVCPTGAIAVDEESGLITVDGGKCVECRVCQEACELGAIEFIKKVVDVEHYLVETVQCPNCGAIYAKNRGECPVCGFATKLIKELYGL